MDSFSWYIILLSLSFVAIIWGTVLLCFVTNNLFNIVYCFKCNKEMKDRERVYDSSRKIVKRKRNLSKVIHDVKEANKRGL